MLRELTALLPRSRAITEEIAYLEKHLTRKRSAAREVANKEDRGFSSLQEEALAEFARLIKVCRTTAAQCKLSLIVHKLQELPKFVSPQAVVEDLQSGFETGMLLQAELHQDSPTKHGRAHRVLSMLEEVPDAARTDPGIHTTPESRVFQDVWRIALVHLTAHGPDVPAHRVKASRKARKLSKVRQVAAAGPAVGLAGAAAASSHPYAEKALEQAIEMGGDDLVNHASSSIIDRALQVGENLEQHSNLVKSGAEIASHNETIVEGAEAVQSLWLRSVKAMLAYLSVVAQAALRAVLRLVLLLFNIAFFHHMMTDLPIIRFISEAKIVANIAAFAADWPLAARVFTWVMRQFLTLFKVINVFEWLQAWNCSGITLFVLPLFLAIGLCFVFLSLHMNLLVLVSFGIKNIVRSRSTGGVSTYLGGKFSDLGTSTIM